MRELLLGKWVRRLSCTQIVTLDLRAVVQKSLSARGLVMSAINNVPVKYELQVAVLT